jgi:hypothetical protein
MLQHREFSDFAPIETKRGDTDQHAHVQNRNAIETIFNAHVARKKVSHLVLQNPCKAI